MKKLIGLLFAVLMVMPLAMATETSFPIGITLTVEEFEPRIWLCDNRVVIDDPVQPGRVGMRPVCSMKHPDDPAECDPECHGPHECFLKGYELVERIENYAFEGEKVEWLVLVMDKNKIEEIEEVVVTLGSEQGPGNEWEVECVDLHYFHDWIPDSCNARIDEEELTEFKDQFMAMYECTLTVETPDSMLGEYFVTVEAIDVTGLSATIDENEFWFFNPDIALSVVGDIVFEDVRPGTIAYSDTILVGNDAESGSGVLLDMFISGTDFYDPDSSAARCVITNRLRLGDNFVNPGLAGPGANDCDMTDTVPNPFLTDTGDHLCYFATNGAYSTLTDGRSDLEGYVPIVYGDAWTRDFYNDAEIMQAAALGPYWRGNLLSPGAEIALTFKLGLPLPCVGDFSDGSLFFWGEAV